MRTTELHYMNELNLRYIIKSLESLDILHRPLSGNLCWDFGNYWAGWGNLLVGLDSLVADLGSLRIGWGNLHNLRDLAAEGNLPVDWDNLVDLDNLLVGYSLDLRHQSIASS